MICASIGALIAFSDFLYPADLYHHVDGHQYPEIADTQPMSLGVIGQCLHVARPTGGKILDGCQDSAHCQRVASLLELLARLVAEPTGSCLLPLSRATRALTFACVLQGRQAVGLEGAG